jgi:hypothetical protein
MQTLDHGPDEVTPVVAAGLVPPPRIRTAARRAVAVVVFAAAAGVIALSVVRGRALQRMRPDVFLGAAPLVGRDFVDGWDWRFGAGLVAAGAVALVVVLAVSYSWFWTAPLRKVALASGAGAMAFATALALTDGADGVLHGAAHDSEYVSGLDEMRGASEFVRTFLARIDDYSVHVRGHPPGFVLVLKFMAAVGLRGVWPVALLSVLASGALVVAVLVAVRSIAGEQWARRSAPFLVVAPYSIWLVTSADAFFTAVGAAAVALIALAVRVRPQWALVAGAAGGIALGALLFLTYLGAVFALVPAVLIVGAVVRRRAGAFATLVGASVGALTVVAGFAVGGFWWADGVRRTRTEYWEGTAQFREWGYFGYSNIAVALIAVGPAVLAGLLRLRDRRVWLLTGSALLALATSHLSQYTRGEVERIWLLFYPLLTVAAGALVVRTARRRAATWVGVQAACAIVLQAALVTKW